jgi:hypothetical protein
MKLRIGRTILPVTSALIAVALLLCGASTTLGQSTQRCWTTVGSAGTVDEADTADVLFNLHTMSVLTRGFPTFVKARYNIVAVEGLFGPGTNDIRMTVRYFDNGVGSLVIRLQEVNMNTGVTTTKITFDSNVFPASMDSQVRTVGPEGPACLGVFFDFSSNLYYLEVELSRPGAFVFGAPSLGGVRICSTVC